MIHLNRVSVLVGVGVLAAVAVFALLHMPHHKNIPDEILPVKVQSEYREVLFGVAESHIADAEFWHTVIARCQQSDRLNRLLRENDASVEYTTDLSRFPAREEVFSDSYKNVKQVVLRVHTRTLVRDLYASGELAP